ncbi:MAG: peptide chain release factor N(5)-glutamine methyltransferase [Melioribacter sp.]|uniref:peptide chain release factor N(5)-glutamine methyltransferase n=1 Tax=Rosettibacter primus TaxID=3111523 RepID=UPI00247F15C9|nr:peptide chain release factor N(5)-glutamine methyltransferase [Melioribacter sp.]
MLTVLESLKLSAEYLEKKGIESPRLNAELLLADVLNCKRLDLYLKYDQPLSEDEINKYREYLSRRSKNEPLQYIVGKAEFYGLEFKVNPSVLIPRPETELLVETIINLEKDKSKTLILDIGTGSGNIAITLAKYLPYAKIIAMDISSEALNVAKENSEFYNTSNQIEFIRKNIFDDFSLYDLKFDVVVSNPPYVSIEDYNFLQKEIINYEPKIAVTDNEDGMKFYKRITQISKQCLKSNGKLFYEIGKGQSEIISKMMAEENFYDIHILKDYQQIDRVIYGTKK